MRYSGNILRGLLPGASSAGASGGWSVEDAVQNIGSGQWPASVGNNDPYFYTNVLLLPGDGTNGGQNNTFLDSSVNNFTITRNGNTTQGSSIPYGKANYSNYFDGSSYITAPASSLFQFGTGDFTIEGWMYTGGTSGTLFDNRTGASSVNPVIFNNAGVITYYVAGAGVITGSTLPLNQWNHIALVRISGSSKLYVNGTQVGSTYTDTNNYSTSGTVIIGAGFGSSNFLTGYLCNVCVTKGQGLYTTNFTPSTLPLNTTSKTVLLTCASAFFYDLSGPNNTISYSGSPRIVGLSPFNGANRTPVSYSGTFNGSTDYLRVNYAAALAFGTADFTIECWYNSTGSGTYSGPFNHASAAATNAGQFRCWTRYNSANQVGFTYSTGAASWTDITTSANVNDGAWHHLAWVRQSGSLRIFVDGSQVNTTVTVTQSLGNSSYPFNIGYNAWDNAYMSGSVSNLRVVNGTALYNANFTPPTTPLTAVSNTSLLTCQSTTFVDNSPNALAILVNGSAHPIQPNPFNYNIALNTGYNTSSNGGSAYFDGNGDYLSLASTTAIGAGNFTMECWVYISSAPSVNYWIYGYRNGADTSPYLFINSSRSPSFGGDVTTYVTGSAIPLNSWTHIAVVRNGTAITMYQNGVITATGTTSQNFSYNGANNLGFANGTNSYFYNGYISNFRIVVGTAIYTGPFVPPASPVTAVTNTQLLMNFTNGNIVDATMENDFETVGNAQISTTIKKFGTGSIYFNNATSGNYVVSPYIPPLNFGNGNATIEFWMYPTSTSAVYQGIIGKPDISSTRKGWAIFQNGTTIRVFVDSTSETVTTSSCLTINTWTYIAVVKNGTNWVVYANGVNVGSGIASSYVDATKGIAIGEMNSAVGWNTTFSYNGYVDDVRISKIVRYTTNFTPPVLPLPVY